MTEAEFQALKLSELRYRKIFETAQDGILVVNFESGKIEEANPFLLALLEYSTADIVGKRLWEIGAMVDKKAALNAFETLKYEKYVRYEDLPLQTLSGSLVNVEFVSNVYDVDGVPLIQCNIRDITSRKKIEVELKNSQQKHLTGMLQTVQALAKVIESRDYYTAGHQLRVSEISVAIGRLMKLDEDELQGIGIAAMIHDIGKMSIPVDILTKPSHLNAFEMGLIRNHVIEGATMIEGVDFPWPIFKLMMQHHERLDGSGYPNGIKAPDILMGARILAVADTLEAMTGKRPYRTAFPLENALELLERDSPALYDHDVVQACMHLFRDKHYPYAVNR